MLADESRKTILAYWNFLLKPSSKNDYKKHVSNQLYIYTCCIIRPSVLNAIKKMDVTWFRQLCLISIPTFRASDLRECVRLRCTKLMVKFSLFVTSTGREEAVQIHVGIYRKTKDHFKKLSKSCYKILEEFFWLLMNIIYAYTFLLSEKIHTLNHQNRILRHEIPHTEKLWHTNKSTFHSTETLYNPIYSIRRNYINSFS